MARLHFDQVNIVVQDVVGASDFLRSLGVDMPTASDAWTEWAPHHTELPATSEGFGADLDSPAFASHWGGLPADVAGIVVNLRTEDRGSVDSTFERALELGAEGLREPYDAFWGARYAVVRGPGPMVVGLMSPVSQESRGQPPMVSDFT